MFSFRRTALSVFCAVVSLTAVQLVAQEQESAPSAARDAAQDAKADSKELIRRGAEALRKGAADIKAGTSGLVKAGLTRKSRRRIANTSRVLRLRQVSLTHILPYLCTGRNNKCLDFH